MLTSLACLCVTCAESASSYYSEGQVPVRHWDTPTLSRLQYRYGRLVIQEAGLYFVYSQVHFVKYLERAGPNSPQPPIRHAHFSHYVYKYNVILANGGDELLLHHSQGSCQNNNNNVDRDEYTSYVGATFRLIPQDEIFIRVSNLSEVMWDPRSTYFGLYRVGPF